MFRSCIPLNICILVERVQVADYSTYRDLGREGGRGGERGRREMRRKKGKEEGEEA